MFEGGVCGLRAMEAAARGNDDDHFAAREALWRLGRIAEGAASLATVDPGLELAGYGKVLHGRPDHHDIGGQELVEGALAFRRCRWREDPPVMRPAQPKVGPGQVRDRMGGKVATDHFDVGTTACSAATICAVRRRLTEPSPRMLKSTWRSFMVLASVKRGKKPADASRYFLARAECWRDSSRRSIVVAYIFR